jgi:hypothetical protein
MSSTLHQRTTGGKSTGGSNSINTNNIFDPTRRLRKIDVYRKIPKDLTEGSAVGGIVTICSIVMLVIIALFELSAVMKISRETDIVVDRGEDELFRVNLNITLKGLSCEFASVDLKNALGIVRQDIDDTTLHKYALDAKTTYVGSATKKKTENEASISEHTYQGTPLDHYGNARHALELDVNTFENALTQYEVLIVDFHSPNCIHCVRFAPIFEHAADLINQRAPRARDGRGKRSITLATVDCVQNFQLCRAQHIQAYPTVLVFRLPKDQDVKREEQQYEAYLGAREAEAIASFALKVLEERINDLALGKDAFKETGKGTDSTGDGQVESMVHSKGCRIEGFLDVRRVPGSVIIRPHSSSSGHEFDTGLIDVDHRIDHLSFGLRGPIEKDDGPYSMTLKKPIVMKRSNTAAANTKDGGGKNSDEDKDDDFYWFKGKEPGYTHVHSIKVVSRTFIPLHDRSSHAFQYSIASDSFKPTDKIPIIQLDYDLSPLAVVVKETKRGWIEGLVGVLAVVGGVFSASYMVESILSLFVGVVMDNNKIA